MLELGYRKTGIPILYIVKRGIMKFSHLDNATTFPGADTRVYGQYRNVFDYNVWTPNTVIKLCRVNWYDDYHDVVKFPDDAARDAWFDKLDGETCKLTTNMYIARADTDGVKLPVPYMTAQRYNYIVVDFSHDIVNTPYQKTDVQTRYHFFVTSVRAEAPNTTTCTLVRDIWTDYINRTTINGLLLSRGHAPLTETTPSKLLENPRANCRDFTLPDVDYGNAATNIRKSTPINLQNGTRYICLAATFSPEQLRSMSNVRGADVTDTSPSYTNADETVNSFVWGAGNINTSNVTGAGTSYNSIDNLTASNVYMYALESSKVSGDYFDTMFAHYPHIMSQIVSVFVATASMMQLGTVTMVNAVEWHTVSGARTKLANINLTTNDFGYAPEYARLTRLYLAPYAYLEVSDNIGNKTRVEIADCGRLSAQTVTSLSYPILRQLAWLDGVGGDGGTSITINAINGAVITADVPNADVLKTLISHDIPTYALQRRAIDAQRAATYNVAVSQARQNAMLTYENGARSANVSQANTYRSSAATVSNTARANQRDVAIKDESNSVRSDNLTYSTTRQNADLGTSTVKINRDVSDDNTLQNKAFVEGTQTQAITNVASAIGTMAGAALVIGTGGAASPVVAGAMAIGGAALQGYNTGIAITNNQELNATSNYVANDKAKTAIQANTEQTQHAITQSTAVTSRANTQADRVTNYSTSAATDMTATSTGTANTNAGASRDLTVDNAKRVMMNARDNTNASWRDMLNHPAQPVGAYGGDNFRQATGLDAMSVKIVTEDNGAIAAAGDYMLRYGIASNKLYNKPTLTACKHYTYWQSADIWLICPFAQNAQLQTLRDVFNAGVTIWNTPEEVGNDFMHDNL